MSLNPLENAKSIKIRIHSTSQPNSTIKQNQNPHRLSAQNIKLTEDFNKISNSSGSIILNLLFRNKVPQKNINIRTVANNESKPKRKLKLNKNNKENFEITQRRQKQFNVKLKTNEILSRQILQERSFKDEISSFGSNMNDHKKSALPSLQKKQPSQNLSNRNLSNRNLQSLTKNSKYHHQISSKIQYNLSGKIQTAQKSQICHQYEIDLPSTFLKQTKQIGIQTVHDEKLNDLHFNEQFSKYKFIKSRLYDQVQHQQQMVDDLIRETINFKKDHQELIASTNSEPSNQREKRVFQLGKELDSAETQVKTAYKKVAEINEQFFSSLENKLPIVQRKKLSLETSLLRLVQVLKYQSESKISGQNNRQNQRNTRILSRIISQLMNLKEINRSCYIFAQKSFELCHRQISEFQTKYSTWSNLYYENRVLLYNFMKQINKIPVITTQLFGCKREEDNDDSSTQKQQGKSMMSRAYGSTKCEQCFHYRQKIGHLQMTNQEIKPIYKALQWLIRDVRKNKSCFQMI